MCKRRIRNGSLGSFSFRDCRINSTPPGNHLKCTQAKEDEMISLCFEGNRKSEVYFSSDLSDNPIEIDVMTPYDGSHGGVMPLDVEEELLEALLKRKAKRDNKSAICPDCNGAGHRGPYELHDPCDRCKCSGVLK